MAVVRFGPIVQSASGALGSVVFSRQGGTAIVRQRPVKVNQESGRQLQVRVNYVRVVAGWRGMSDAIRLEWFRCAEIYRRGVGDGVGRPLTGFQVFAMVALRVLDISWDWELSTFRPDAWFESVESVGVRVDVWPGGPVNFVHSRGVVSADPPGISYLTYDLAAQRVCRVSPTWPGRTMVNVWHQQSRTYSNNLWAPYDSSGALSYSRWLAQIGLLGVGEWIRWRCVSHLFWWPAATTWSGASQVPMVTSELVTNGDMELPYDGGIGARDGWLLAGAGVKANETFNVWGDAFSLKWTRAAAAGNSAVYTPNTINLSPGGTYVLRFAAKCDLGTAWNQVYVYNPTIGVNTFTTTAPPADGLWHEYEYSVVLPSGGANSKLQFANTNATNMSVWLDNVSIRRNL